LRKHRTFGQCKVQRDVDKTLRRDCILYAGIKQGEGKEGRGIRTAMKHDNASTLVRSPVLMLCAIKMVITESMLDEPSQRIAKTQS
jgi:hypothetical protein